MSVRLLKLLPAAAVCALPFVLSQSAMAQAKAPGGPGMAGPGSTGPRPLRAPGGNDINAIRTEKPPYANFYMQTNIGSFRMMEYNDGNQPEGRFEMSFTGTCLVDTTKAFKHNRNLTTNITTTGNLRKELDFHGRIVYHGTGTIVVDGGWHAINFFGTKMNSKFNGYGVFRLSGEFDKTLNTGYFWYDNGKKIDWGTAGNQPTVPPPSMGTEKPTIQFKGKG